MNEYLKEEMDRLNFQFWASRQFHSGEKKSVTPAHYHNYIEIIYCTDGNYDVWLNDNCYHCREGNLILINSEEVHSLDSISEYNSLLVLRFDPEMLYNTSQSLFEIKYILPFLINSNTPQKVFKSSEISSTCIPSLMQSCVDEYHEKKYGYELAIRANICNIFLWILRYWYNMGIDVTTYNLKNPELIPDFQQVLSYLSQHFAEAVTAEQMAKMCNLSYSYFSRCFKQLLNRSFSDYLNYLRISESIKLLITTELNITEIALQSGFSTSSYFIQQFKAYKGMSPKRFRQMISK